MKPEEREDEPEEERREAAEAVEAPWNFIFSGVEKNLSFLPVVKSS